MTSRPSADDFRGQMPTYWVMDLIPPEEWDYETPKWVLGELFARGITSQQIGKTALQEAIEDAAKQIAAAFATPMAQISQALESVYPVVGDVIKLNGTLVKIDEEKNGTYTVVPYKNLGLPTRKINTGPPINPHARHGKGGRR